MKKHITTVNKGNLSKTVRTGGCGECPSSCQSACKTSCTVGNQVCERREELLADSRRVFDGGASA